MKRLSILSLIAFGTMLVLGSCERTVERYCFTVSNKAPKVGERTTLDAKCSEGVDLYHWNFGDGRDTVTKTNTVDHAFEHPGQYEITLHSTHLQIQDGCGPNPAANAGARQSVTVEN